MTFWVLNDLSEGNGHNGLKGQRGKSTAPIFVVCLGNSAEKRWEAGEDGERRSAHSGTHLQLNIAH